LGNIVLSDIDRVLIIKLRHIGDVLLSSATFKALKDARPGIRTAALVPAGTEDMLTLNPSVDEVITFRKGQGLANELRLIRKLRQGRYDLAINMTEGDRGALLALFSGARYRIGFDPGSRGFFGKKLLYTETVKQVYDGRHRAVIDMDVLGPLGIMPEEIAVELFTSASDDEYVSSLLMKNGMGAGTKIAVVHPTSRWLFKCWRDEAVAEVIDRLEASGLRVVVTSGPDEREMEKAARIISLAASRPVDFTGRLTLKRLAALFKMSSIFFGVDTAPMHMAAAVGIPVVALFGPSDFRLWGPFSDKAKLLAKTSDFPCIPCHRDGCNGTKKSICLEAIAPDEVMEAVAGLLK